MVFCIYLKFLKLQLILWMLIINTSRPCFYNHINAILHSKHQLKHILLISSSLNHITNYGLSMCFSFSIELISDEIQAIYNLAINRWFWDNLSLISPFGINLSRSSAVKKCLEDGGQEFIFKLLYLLFVCFVTSLSYCHKRKLKRCLYVWP